MEIHIQPVLPPPRLVVYGLSPTARALVRLGKAMGYAVSLVDPAAEPSDFPEADAVFTDPRAPAVASASRSPSVATFAVVATQGQWDEEATVAALALRPDYLGVMASAKRFGEMSALLMETADAAGVAELGRIKNPAGLDLGAQLPEEIALSILAEIVEKRRAAARGPDTHVSHAANVAGSHAEAQPSLAVHAQAATEERDPVCGMMVVIAGAAHTAAHAGLTYYFCCGGCRQRFLAAPDRYLNAPAPAAPPVDGGPHVGATIRVKR